MKTLKITIALLACISSLNVFSQHTKPNLVIIHTDEHNFRTLGCYREIVSNDQAFIWGKGVEVKTPNIDRLAHEGALCNNFYAASPLCTPSRAALVSGLYPIATGSPKNDLPMHNEVVTFAHVLKQQGYSTSYVGKWHLDGDAKPGFAPKRKFGFTDNRYMFNRGHWKALGDKEGKPVLLGKYDEKRQSQSVKIDEVRAEQFTTDYLTTKTLEIIERDKNKPFCVMVSIPDPHGPNIVREPYIEMYKHLKFEEPKTMNVPMAESPKWANRKRASTGFSYKQDLMQKYFGMVKCIDDNVGRILSYLDENNLAENTIVVFTSDHGDLMGEHKLHNKGLPYEGSARIPFVIRYPKKIRAGKIIRRAYTTTDFAPTILGIMDAGKLPKTHGIDASNDFLNQKKEVLDDRITYMTMSRGSWACAFNNRYKLVLSTSDKPWLFDLKADPDEIQNFYADAAYKKIALKFEKELLSMMKKYNDPTLTAKGLQVGSNN